MQLTGARDLASLTELDVAEIAKQNQWERVDEIVLEDADSRRAAQALIPTVSLTPVHH